LSTTGRLPSRLCADTSALEDLRAAGVLRLVLRRRSRWAVPDVACASEARLERLVKRFGLGVQPMTENEVLAVSELRARYPALSVADAAILAMAKARGMVLLTSDRRLRNAAVREGVETHGSLWVLDLLWKDGLIGFRRYTRALRMMREAGRRLPRAEIEKRLVRRPHSGDSAG
jgi:predicted nucleic acid-binding protein